MVKFSELTTLAVAKSHGVTIFAGNIIWLVVYQPLWKMMEFVSWDDDIPNIWEHKILVPNHQSVM